MSAVATVVLATRVPETLITQLDAIAEAHGGGLGRVTRADVVRRLLADGIAAHAPKHTTAARTRAR